MSTPRLRAASSFVNQQQIGADSFGERDGRSFAEVQIIRHA
jgi:hypothetical protein